MKADDFLSNIQSNGVPALRSDGASVFGLIVDEVLLSVVVSESSLNDRCANDDEVAVPVSDFPICIKLKVFS